jgi:hypothetical protein
MKKELIILESILAKTGFNYSPEYRFYPGRRFKFDYFIHIENKGIGIEYEGGVFNSGRHIRPTGFINDCTKYNLANSLNIPVLRYTVKHLAEPDKVENEIIFTIDNLLKNRTN